jgi:hypothetical protein
LESLDAVTCGFESYNGKPHDCQPTNPHGSHLDTAWATQPFQPLVLSIEIVIGTDTKSVNGLKRKFITVIGEILGPVADLRLLARDGRTSVKTSRRVQTGRVYTTLSIKSLGVP